MILSIVPLPEFAGDGTILDGESFGGIYNSSSMADVLDNVPVQGRKWTIEKGVFKYKMQVYVRQNNRFYTIVFVAEREINLNHIDPDIAIIPLYVREYGQGTSLRSNCILWLPGINSYFEHCFMPHVCSLVSAFRYMMSLGTDEVSHIPTRILDNMYDERLATLAPINQEIGEAFMVGGSESARHELELVSDYGCILTGYLPREIMVILNAGWMRDLLPDLDRHHLMSQISIGVMSSMPTWSAYYEWIHKCDDSCPRYVVNDPSGEMPNLLFHAAMMPTIDFKMKCSPSQRVDKSALLFDCNQKFDIGRTSNFARLNKLSGTVSEMVDCGFNWVHDTTYTAVGSYLEDLLIYDTSDELIAYVDMVWWILAAGGGLLNERCVYI